MQPKIEEKILEVIDLKKYFPIRGGIFSKSAGNVHAVNVHAVDGVSFWVKRGEVLGLVGESGCGKTTIGRLILRLMEPTSGQIKFEGKDLSFLNREEMQKLRQKMTVIFQDPYAALDPRMSVERIISEPLKIHKVCRSSSEVRDRVAQVLQRVGLRPEHMSLYPHQFSGGQRQRIAIARTLVLNPSFIIADEPVSALDVSIQAQILNLLRDLQNEFNLTYLFIAHDLRVVEYMSNRVAVMYLGRIMEMACVENIYSRPRHPYTEALLSAVPMPDPKIQKKRITLYDDVPSPINPPSGCVFHPRCFYRQEDCERIIPDFKEIEPDHYISCHHPLN
uniref:Dipeptide ABC transporter ATP-binding protein n=1 Tax=candidate division CPR3 bacterium TaxID=2268181 RepID=A0A7V3JAU4_UNCC3